MTKRKITTPAIVEQTVDLRREAAEDILFANGGAILDPDGAVRTDDGVKPSKRRALALLPDIEDDPSFDDGEAEAMVHSANSVVKSAYKQRYLDRANALQRKPKGVPTKALKRMSGDWLAIELAKLTLDTKAKLVVGQFEAVLDANGVPHAHWNRTTKGWQGRLRMTGRLALERVVAANGVLAVPTGEALPAPRAWVAAHTR